MEPGDVGGQGLVIASKLIMTGAFPPARDAGRHVGGCSRDSGRSCNCTCYITGQGAPARDWLPALQLCPIVQRIAATRHAVATLGVCGPNLSVVELTLLHGPFLCWFPPALRRESRGLALPKPLQDPRVSDP